jgi:hypothetical protein
MNVNPHCIQQFIDNELVQLPVLVIDGKITIIDQVKPVSSKSLALRTAQEHCTSFLMKNAIKVPFSKLTAKLAKTWLIIHDSEAADFWNSVKDKEGLIGGVEDNLKSFGIINQSSTLCYITSNNEVFAGYGTNGSSQY